MALPLVEVAFPYMVLKAVAVVAAVVAGLGVACYPEGLPNKYKMIMTLR